MKKLFLYIFLGLLLCNAGVAKEIIDHYSVDVYDRFKIEKLDDKNKVNFAIERVSQRLREVISASGFTASVGKTTSEIKATSVAGHFHINLEIQIMKVFQYLDHKFLFLYLCQLDQCSKLSPLWMKGLQEKAEIFPYLD